MALDFVTEGHGECALDELWRLGTTERAKSRVAFVTCGSVSCLVDNDVVLSKVNSDFTYRSSTTYFFLSTIRQHNSIYAAADVGVDGRLVACFELLKHVE